MISDDERAANRAGGLHATQRARGLQGAEERLRRGVLLQAAGAAAFLLPQLLHVFPRLLKDFSFTPVLAAPTTAALVMFGLFGLVLGGLPLYFGMTERREGLREHAAFRRGVVQAVEGEVKRGYTRYAGHAPTTCFVAGRALRLGVVPWSALEGKSSARVYFLVGVDEVLSVEP